MKKIISKISKALERLFVLSKKIIRSNDNRYVLRALASLFVFVFVIGQAIKEFFFKNNLSASVLIFLVVAYLSYSHFDEHVVLTIAMLMCLYFSYDTLTSLLKGELRSRNDQIYKEFLNTTREQIVVLAKKRKMVQELETFSSKIEQLKNSSSTLVGSSDLDLQTFQPAVQLIGNLELTIYEELYYLDFVHRAKNDLFERTALELDKDLEFTNTKIEELSSQLEGIA